MSYAIIPFAALLAFVAVVFLVVGVLWVFSLITDQIHNRRFVRNLRGSITRYDDPFGPLTDGTEHCTLCEPGEWQIVEHEEPTL